MTVVKSARKKTASMAQAVLVYVTIGCKVHPAVWVNPDEKAAYAPVTSPDNIQ